MMTNPARPLEYQNLDLDLGLSVANGSYVSVSDLRENQSLWYEETDKPKAGSVPGAAIEALT